MPARTIDLLHEWLSDSDDLPILPDDLLEGFLELNDTENPDPRIEIDAAGFEAFIVQHTVRGGEAAARLPRIDYTPSLPPPDVVFSSPPHRPP